MRRRQTIASTEESGSMPRFRAIPLTAFACALGVALGAQANTASAQADCPNAGLRAGVASHLPDCRAYEQVSPTEKNGSDVGNIPLTNFGAGGPSSPSGDAVAFTAYGALSNTQWGGGGTLLYLSRRGDAAWTTTALIPRPVDTGGLTIFTNSIMGFTPDLTGSLLVSGVGLTSEAPNDRNYYRQVNLSGAIT